MADLKGYLKDKNENRLHVSSDNASGTQNNIDLAQPHKIGEIDGRPIYEIQMIQFNNTTPNITFSFSFANCEDIATRPYFGDVLSSDVRYYNYHNVRADAHIKQAEKNKRTDDTDDSWYAYYNNDTKMVEIYNLYYPSGLPEHPTIRARVNSCVLTFCLYNEAEETGDIIIDDEDIPL